VGGRSPVEYAYALRNLDPAKLTLIGLPGASVSGGGGYLGEELRAEGKGFLRAVAADRAAAYVEAHPKLVDKS